MTQLQCRTVLVQCFATRRDRQTDLVFRGSEMRGFAPEARESGARLAELDQRREAQHGLQR
jgi:hypothetical protein